MKNTGTYCIRQYQSVIFR